MRYVLFEKAFKEKKSFGVGHVSSTVDDARRLAANFLFEIFGAD